jgi:two-component system nitrate/nitrite response regulator NarL
VTETPLRVLVADDDDRIAELIRSILEEDGRFTVVARAADGMEAIDLAAVHHPDLVLMDIEMPGCDGIEATRLIHALDARQHVVIYTGSDEYADVRRAEAAGAVGYLHKDALKSPELAETLLVLHRNYERAVPDPE